MTIPTIHETRRTLGLHLLCQCSWGGERRGDRVTKGLKWFWHNYMFKLNNRRHIHRRYNIHTYHNYVILCNDDVSTTTRYDAYIKRISSAEPLSQISFISSGLSPFLGKYICEATKLVLLFGDCPKQASKMRSTLLRRIHIQPSNGLIVSLLKIKPNKLCFAIFWRCNAPTNSLQHGFVSSKQDPKGGSIPDYVRFRYIFKNFQVCVPIKSNLSEQKSNLMGKPSPLAPAGRNTTWSSIAMV